DPASSREGRALHPSHSSCERVEHAVDELRALERSVSFGQKHGFLNDDAWRRLTALQLRGSEPEHTSVDDRQALETPVHRDFRQLPIELGPVAQKGANEKPREPTLFGR